MEVFVPAEEAEVSIVDRVFTRIGAADDLTGGRSTFMVEMSETCHALKEATRRSLILLDEVGRGTSTYDGMALAHAIVEYIHDHVGAKTLFSTHYHELTRLEESLSRLKNVHAQCIERNGKVVFLHRIVPGGADRSYGIHVAELGRFARSSDHKGKTVVIRTGKRYGRTRNIHTPPDPSGQLSLFDPIESDQAAKPASAQTQRTDEEEDILEAIRKLDLMNKTPFECMQFLHEIKQKLN